MGNPGVFIGSTMGKRERELAPPLSVQRYDVVVRLVIKAGMKITS